MREIVWHILVILMIAGAVFYTNLGEARLWDRDEPRNAGCAAEMMARGDWVVPMFNDELRHQKPVLLYWFIMSAYALFGVNEFSARFWSATLGMASVLATYGIGRRLANSRIGLIAAVALSTSLMFDVAARAATPDSVLIFCSTFALLFYVLGTFKREGNRNPESVSKGCFPQRLPFVVAMYGMMGLGVLAKGPVGFLIPMAIIGMFMLIQRLPGQEELPVISSSSRLARIKQALFSAVRPFRPLHFLKTFWAMKPALAVLVVLIVAAPWYLLVDSRTQGDFTAMFFVGEHFGRATTAMENHSGGLWFYPLAILVGFFPWSVFWGPVAVGLVGKRSRFSVANRLMLCAVGVQVGAFSLAQTKLPSYVTPCYPALAILTAICLEEFSLRRSSVHRGWFYGAFAGFLFAGLVVTGGLRFAASKYLPNQIWLAAWGAIPIVASGLMIWMLMNNRTRPIPAVFASASALFCWGLFGFGTVAIDGEQRSHLILDEVKSAPPESALAAYGCLESSWVFYGQRPIRELTLESPPENSLSNQGSNNVADSEESKRPYWQPKQRVSVEAFLDCNPNGMIITTQEHIDDMKKRLPEHYEVLQTAEYFLRGKQLYLLGQPVRRLAVRPSSTNAGHSNQR